MSLVRAVLLVLISLLTIPLVVPLSSPTPIISAEDPGTIAYFRRSTDEVRLIQPDGTNDRKLWTAPTANSLLAVVHLEWRPDGGELAFSSDQEDLCSVYDSDVYTILNNGTGLRRVTNSPACSELASYPKGTVVVTVPDFGGVVGVYVQGAPVARTTGYGTLTFTDVADFGPGVLQSVVGIWGMYRRLAPGVDVQAGQTVYVSLEAPSIAVPDYGTGDLSWRSNGSQIGYTMRNGGDVYQISTNPPLGSVGQTLPTAANTLSSLVAWGPASKPDQFLYYAGYGSMDAEGIYINSTTQSDGGTRLVSPSSIFQQFGSGDPPFYVGYDASAVHDLKWLPDGSGFLFTITYIYVNIDDRDTCMGTCSDVFEYHFTSPTTGTLTQVTRLAAATGTSDDDTARGLSISPDGQQVAIERVTGDVINSSSSIWVMGRDGSGLRKLVDNAWSPAWGRTAATPLPTPTSAIPATPTPTATSIPGSTPTPTSVPGAASTPTSIPGTAPTPTSVPNTNLPSRLYVPVITKNSTGW